MTGLRGYASFHGGHTTYGDGEGDIAGVARAAAEAGFAAFGFTEHFPAPWLRCDAVPVRGSDWLGAYVDDVRAAQSTHAQQTRILLGAEVEYVTGEADRTRRAVEPHGFDYLVGSVHYVRCGEVDVCIDWKPEWAREALDFAGSAEALYLHYLAHVDALLDWRLARVVGHIDLVKIHLSSEPVFTDPTAAVRERMTGVLERMRDDGVAMDINARGFIKPCAALYPSDWVLAEAARIGTPVTLGDDSHAADQVGARLPLAVEALRRTGHTKMSLVTPGGDLEQVPFPGG